ncbi:cupin domain-containing protein [Mangrovicoccus ximenensis]|uniref:cupin domain-containing protein n=1 Tax=Mangrovicoccus ximenensis TaxID=1911570 RepID=UPI000D33E785|nr:cupin domain-containing protein [Mangrovicoccus ximenensis]
MIIDRSNAEHYNWGAGCDGWILGGSPELSVIHERMPSGTAETRHVHGKARQVFFVLEGVLTMERGPETFRIGPQQSLEIPPGLAHRARNDGPDDVLFLVISAPAARGDRTELAGG